MFDFAPSSGASHTAQLDTLPYFFFSVSYYSRVITDALLRPASSTTSVPL